MLRKTILFLILCQQKYKLQVYDFCLIRLENMDEPTVNCQIYAIKQRQQPMQSVCQAVIQPLRILKLIEKPFSNVLKKKIDSLFKREVYFQFKIYLFSYYLK